MLDPEASKTAYEGTHKPIEAPTLRRDPAAYEKMAVMRRWEQAAEERGCSVKGLPVEAKQELERKWAWTRDTVMG